MQGMMQRDAIEAAISDEGLGLQGDAETLQDVASFDPPGEGVSLTFAFDGISALLSAAVHYRA